MRTRKNALLYSSSSTPSPLMPRLLRARLSALTSRLGTKDIRSRPPLGGARFLAELAKSGRLGLCNPYGDPEDASYCTVNLDAGDTWERQVDFFEALLRVCHFFGIEPVLDSSFHTEEFFDGLVYFTRKLDMKDRYWSGTLSFTLTDYKEDALRSTDEECTFVIEETPSMDICGIHCEAHVRYVSKGKLKSEEKTGGLACDIVGEHIIYMDKVLPE